jgi:enoyl-CoA hydratase/carnithine racemase
MSAQDISVTRTNQVLHLRLNRPGKRNALTVAMYAALADALTAAETDGTVVVILSGEGAGFCAGNDLADFVAHRPDGPDAEEAPVHRFLRAIATSTRILIAAVHGKAIGVGTTMLLHCDFVVAEQGAELRMPFTDLALVPEAASSLLVPALVGHQRAASLLMLGDPLDAAQAHALGFVNEVVAAGAGLAAAEALAARLLAKPQSAILATKRLMKSATRDVAGRMAEEGAAFSAQLETPELAAIVAGFFNARSKAA